MRSQFLISGVEKNMRANRVEAAIARYREAGTKKMRAIGIARKWGARTWGFYCTYICRECSKPRDPKDFLNFSSTLKQ